MRRAICGASLPHQGGHAGRRREIDRRAHRPGPPGLRPHHARDRRRGALGRAPGPPPRRRPRRPCRADRPLREPGPAALPARPPAPPRRRRPSARGDPAHLPREPPGTARPPRPSRPSSQDAQEEIDAAGISVLLVQDDSTVVRDPESGAIQTVATTPELEASAASGHGRRRARPTVEGLGEVLYAATLIREPLLDRAVPTLVLARADDSAQLATADLVRALTVAAIVLLAIGIPLAARPEPLGRRAVAPPGGRVGRGRSGQRPGPAAHDRARPRWPRPAQPSTSWRPRWMPRDRRSASCWPTSATTCARRSPSSAASPRLSATARRAAQRRSARRPPSPTRPAAWSACSPTSTISPWTAPRHRTCASSHWTPSRSWRPRWSASGRG